MNRRLLAAFALCALVFSSGCLSFFGSNSVPPEQLDAAPPQEYAWDADVDAHITVTENAKFQAVYRVNETTMTLYRRDGFGGRTAIPVSAVRYRYPNGTVITGSQFDEHGGNIERTRQRVTVTMPSDGSTGGKLAFTSESTPKRFSLPTFVDGSYEVVLPPNRRVEMPVFGSVSPGGYERSVDAQGRTHLRWPDVTARAVVVQFYLQRDLYVFGGLAAVLLGAGVVGSLYYRRRIAALRRRREEYGLDVDDDDFGGGPPGMG